MSDFVAPFLKPRPPNRPMLDWRLEAIRHVRLLMGQGYRRFAAQQQVAVAVGKTIDELQEWERELVKSSDHENDLLCSELAGEFLEYLTSGHYTNIPQYRTFGSYGGLYNIARAATIVKNRRQHSLADIRTALRSGRRG
jgi:hypothetical protein